MSNQLLTAELTALSQEAKRKSPEIRTAAEKSLQDLRSLPSTSEQQLAADLSRKSSFIDPFVLACNARNVRLASSAINCLQRLVIIKGIPRPRLKDVLDSFQSCTALSMDVQLKILQALPALTQTYADDLKNDLLASTLQICAALQNVKLATISGVATATFQQLVISLFEKVTVEDAESRKTNLPPITEVPGDAGPIPLRESAFDAYRVFLDLALAVDGRKTNFVGLANFPPSLGLEFIWSSLDAHKEVFATHQELVNVLRSVVLPFLIRTLSERETFPLTLRAIRIVPLILQQHVQSMPEECEILLGLLTYMVEPDSATPWKRAMCMEVFRSLYATPGLALQIYMQYDEQHDKKTVIRDNVASFVRLSSEKSAVIGLGQQSSVPTGPTGQRDSYAEQVALEAAGGVAGVMPLTPTVTETNVPGISSQWSLPKIQYMDNLDKSDPPPLPETYVYTLVLECLNSLSETLAKVVLPLTVRQNSNKAKKSQAQQSSDEEEETGNDRREDVPDRPKTRTKRSLSYRARTVPLNPLTLEHIPAAPKIRAIANLIDGCWPALLATSSTFLYSALDNDYYRSLIRSVQRFAQVSGLLDITTARDAFLTTLGKAAVPANALKPATDHGGQSPAIRQSSVYSNTKGTRSVDSIVSSTSASTSGHSRQASQDNRRHGLTTRNLLCLRALLNLAIAIGPTLGASFSIILDTLQQADVILNLARMQGGYGSKHSELGNETSAVGAAAMRLFESTADYPNDSFLQLLTILCTSLDTTQDGVATPQTPSSPGTQPRPRLNRIPSIVGRGMDADAQSQHRILLLSKLGQVADLNVARFSTYPASESGWRMMTSQLIAIAVNAESQGDIRSLSADIVSRCSVALAQMSISESANDAENVQRLALSSLQHLLQELYAEEGDLTATDIAIHGRVLEAEKTIIDTCGEILVAGWDIMLTSVETAFHDEATADLVSLGLGRMAFSVIQSICSDFLPSLPSSSIRTLVQILFQFATQDLDTITLFHDVSTFLVKDALSDLNRASSDLPVSASRSLDTFSEQLDRDSHAILWVTLLSCLADVVSDDKIEIRNGAFQTLLRILSDQDFAIDTWGLCIRLLFFRVLQTDLQNQERKRSEGRATSKDELTGLESTSKTLLAGIASLLSQNINVIVQIKDFNGMFDSLLAFLKSYCELHSQGLIQASFTALNTMLATVPSLDDQWRLTLDHTASFWAQNMPQPADQTGTDSEQDALSSYTTCAEEIYRLTKDTITSQQVCTIANNLALCIRQPSLPPYGNDINSMTPLQARVLRILRTLRTDLDGVPSQMLDIVAALIELPFKSKYESTRDSKSPSYVAISKACMEWLSILVTAHKSDQTLFASESLEEALHSLVVPIEIKYDWKQPGKQLPPWKQATMTALEVIPLIMASTLLPSNGIQSETQKAIWRQVVSIACGIMHGDYSSLNIPDSYDDVVTVEDDEQFDHSSLLQLRSTMIPDISSPSLPSALRVQYTASLFKASIIHSLERNEVDHIRPLLGLLKPRFGRVHDPEASRREDLAYFCFAELIAMVSSTPASFPYHTSTAHKNPYEPAREYGSELAPAAAPYLLARLALPLKAYIADQPLRGRWPMPISMIEEVMWTLDRMKELRCVAGIFGSENKAMEGLAAEIGHGPKDTTDQRAHLRILYPLLVKAVGVAGNSRHGNAKILAKLGEVLNAVPDP